ncbi:hypothetical protein CWI75_02785 [Kineobactrum sediminis]|uniref:M23ase beta-sheet core domain-containing protein n=1 Tax=Kineobactrum sediminis TaxID=1905677 RepID=A0A2N5Y7A8_9GAMM|nr:peptidoglycan DD-metalloendopeptidase family protein [Kineobactrum sediminis]PLW84283.1 hypothetical protein CWI75_02785 [Kineobactrum sediminis]
MLRGPSLLLLLTAVCTLMPLAASAETEETRARAELRELQQKIEQISRELAQARTRLGDLQQQLRQTETTLGELLRSIADNLEATAATQDELAALQARRVTLQQARDSQQARIRTELGAAWKMGQDGQIKVLLNQESPHTVARAMAYYRYFFNARNALVEAYRGTLKQLAEVRASIEESAAQLTAQQQALQQQRQQVVAAQQQRKQVLARLGAEIRGKDDELERLQQDRAELEELLDSIAQNIAQMQLPDDYKPFANTRGSLAWPVPGKRGNSFGASRGAGGMRWHGINLRAGEGTEVKAIHHGRVVYADWLRGSGLLLIIDHGEGYMSLYAHNQSLLREVGEWVGPGTIIGTVGNTGGAARAGLYFEIRKDGKPVDPVIWCQ